MGQILRLRLEIDHPPDQVVIFPDSSWDFQPFELVRILPIPTRTEAGRSHDAAIYSLRSFELLGEVQLKLPWSLVSGSDTLQYYAQSDTLWMKWLVEQVSPPPPFQDSPGILLLRDPPNYLLWGGIGIVSGTLLLLLLIAFRRPMQRMLARRKIRAEWATLQKRLQQLPLEAPGAFMDGLNQAWRDYLKTSGKASLRSLTTTELASQLPLLVEINRSGHGLLLEIAHKSDGVIYAGQNLESSEMARLREQCSKLLESVYQQRLAQTGAPRK